MAVKSTKPKKTSVWNVPNHASHTAEDKQYPKQKASKHSATPVASRGDGPRRLARQKRTWYKPRTWRQPQTYTYTPLPKARYMLTESYRTLSKAKKAVLGITAVYAIGALLLVRGFTSNQDLSSFRALLDGIFTGAGGKAQSVALQLSYLFGGFNKTDSPNGSLYQTILLVVCSLALIWVFRQTQAKKTVTTKTAFYNGMYPVIPFLGVLLIVGIQLVPASIGSYLYSTLVSTGIAVQPWEKLAAILVFVALLFWSLRMITASLFALYIVTLPDMYPLQAIRSAKKLVQGRRLLVWSKLIVLPLVILVSTSLFLVPFIFFAAPAAVWVFFITSSLWFGGIHAYLYTLYRELLNHA